MAGVSAGTVDRVLHNRGDVSRTSREKVQKVLDEIDYHPNMFAIGLAAKKRYHIICIIPYYIEHDYWSSVAQGIERAAQELRPFNVGIDYVFYNHADKTSYEKACALLQAEPVDAVLIAPNFQDETLRLTSYLESKKVPYAFIDFNMEQTHALCYIGQDSKISGYIAAKILMNRYQEGQEIVLFLNNQKNSPAEVQMQRRLEGFMQYFAAEHKDLIIHDVVLHKENTASNEELLDIFFAEHPKAALGAVFNSRVYQVVLGAVKRKFIDNMYVFQPTGGGRVGISTEADKSKAMEVYPGMDYEVTVWVKALSLGNQNIEFGVNCYDENFNLINQVRITDWRETNSFFTGSRYQSPCKVPGIYYRLRGIIYNVLEQKDESLYLNFENGRPLRFIGDVKYMAPYIVQDRDSISADILIAGIVLKPLDLPFSQGYLGQKNVIAMYAQIKSARTKNDIEEFVRRYLVSYKNVVSYTWLDWVVRTSYFLTFNVKRELDGQPIQGAQVELSNGFISSTDANGYVRFEVSMNEVIRYTITAKGITQTGEVTMDKDKTLDITMNLPLDVNIEIVEPGWGTATVEGSRLPRTEITLTATPSSGYTFKKWNIITDATEDVRNPTQYWVGDHDLDIQAIFERNSELTFTPSAVEIPATGGIQTIVVSASKKWALDPLPDNWAKVTPMSGDEGETPIRIEIDQQG